MDIPELVNYFSRLQKHQLTFEELGDVVRSIEWKDLDYQEYLPEIDNSFNYSRNILLLEPLELVLLRWPEGVESGIHWHEGFYGYVVCLEGVCDNVTYFLHDNVLKEDLVIRGIQDGIIEEKDGVIHKLCNPSHQNETVTLHIYYPTLETFQGMKIFDIENGRIGVLNEDAGSASWEEPKAHFSKIVENAFHFQSHFDRKKSSHRLFPVIPKPNSETITKMLQDYYDEQAHEYDFFDTQHPSRNAYTEKVNSLIAERINELDVKCYLDLACGTGRRALKIKKLAQTNYKVTGVDLSPEMCEVARQKGIETSCNSWKTYEYPENHFDVVSFLYAFGHVCSRQNRLEALKSIYRTLKPGGYLFFDVFNLDDKTEWGPNAMKAYQSLRLADAGYEKGDVFYKKENGNAVAYLHYFTEIEVRDMLDEAGFVTENIMHIGYVHQPGKILSDGNGSLFVIARKKL